MAPAGGLLRCCQSELVAAVDVLDVGKNLDAHRDVAVCSGSAVAELAVGVIAPDADKAVVVPAFQEREAVGAAGFDALCAVEVADRPGDVLAGTGAARAVA